MTPDHKTELLAHISGHINNHPRSQQQVIGPSEIGHPCDRWMAYKMGGRDKQGSSDRQPVISRKWRPTVGTAVHAWLEEAFTAPDNDEDTIRYLPEKRVHVGNIPGARGYAVWGSCDLYDVAWRTVVDWKIVGKATLDRVRRHGASEQYRVQAHAYGRGYKAAGLPVDRVAVLFLPAAGELDDSVYWSEAYDEQTVLDGLDRVGEILTVIDDGGLSHDNLAALPTAAHFCLTCPFFRKGSTDFSTGCPGADGMKNADPLFGLI